MNLTERRNTLDEALSKGHIASVVWIKKDGSERKATLKLWEEKMLASGDRNVVGVNTTDHIPELYTAVEVSKKWVKIYLPGLLSVTYNGKTVNFQ